MNQLMRSLLLMDKIFRTAIDDPQKQNLRAVKKIVRPPDLRSLRRPGNDVCLCNGSCILTEIKFSNDDSKTNKYQCGCQLINKSRPDHE